MKPFKFELGDEARDAVSEFAGVIVARAEHITGCNTYGLQPKAKDGKKGDSEWFDEQRLIAIGSGQALRDQLSAADDSDAVRKDGAGPNPVSTNRIGSANR